MRQIIVDSLFRQGIIPVVRVPRLEHALPLCRALADGGLPVIEITFRSQAAAPSIRAVREAYPELCLGAGTVTSVAAAKEAVASGAAFLVTPGLNQEVVRWCLEMDVPIFPGCATASEVETAMNLGLDLVKFFPAEQSGGLAAIKALGGPYSAMRFMPTGGITVQTMGAYLAHPSIVACGGSFMVPEDRILAGDWQGLAKLAAMAASAAHGFALNNVTLFAKDHDEARTAGESLAAILGRTVRQTDGGMECGPDTSVAWPDGDRKGLLTYSVLNVGRSAAMLQAKGFTVLGPEGKDGGAVLEHPVLGFTLGLVPQKTGSGV